MSAKFRKAVDVMDAMVAVAESGYKWPEDSYGDIVYFYVGPVTLRAMVIRHGR